MRSVMIPKLRRLYARIRAKYRHCKIVKASPQPPEMAILPSVRLKTCIRPFINVGIDYFGPMEVTIGRYFEKRWGVIYLYLSIRANDLKIVNSLTTDRCI